MAIENTYLTLLTEDYIKDQLSRGVAISAQDVADEIESLVASLDLSQPLFVASSYYVERGEISSANRFRNTFSSIRLDLRVLYKELLALSKINQNAFERWDLEARNIEKKLIDLENRIENLLLLTQDTEGYHSILVDNFTDTILTDTTNTSAELDLSAAVVEMASPTSESGNTRLFLNNLQVSDDVTFRVRTTVDMLSRVDATTSSMVDMFAQESKTWWTSVNMKVQKPVTCELTVRLSPDDPVSISRIFMELHDSAESSPIWITPLYSTDNRNWNQIPSTTYTIEARTTAVFQFTPVEAKYVKFLLNKTGPDPSSGINYFSYQFGFKNIEFYLASFDKDNPSIFISQPMYVLDTSGAVKGFEKITCETCERLETGTDIDYYITVSNDPTVPLDSDLNPTDGTWVPITPLNRAEQVHPYILNVGDILETTIGDTEQSGSDTEVLGISYLRENPLGDDLPTDFTNPAAAFDLLEINTGTGAVQSVSRTADTIVRYNFINSNERILNYQVRISGSAAIDLDKSNIILFRNSGKRGFTPADVNTQVRGIQRGWKFEDPYYCCVIEILNPNGITIDVGDTTIIIDDVTYSNVIDNTILTGKSGLSGDSGRDSGIHSIKVHKSNWIEVMPELNTLAALQQADTLYPYNHKLLIEGYEYGSSYPDTDEQVYTGVDLFAESVLTQVSIFDLTRNIESTNYGVFAIDYDAPKSWKDADSPPPPDDEDNESSMVFVVKVDENNPDFQNERFVLRFTLINELRKYLRLRADLSTESDQISPALHSYKIKLG